MDRLHVALDPALTGYSSYGAFADELLGVLRRFEGRQHTCSTHVALAESVQSELGADVIDIQMVSDNYIDDVEPMAGMIPVRLGGGWNIVMWAKSLRARQFARVMEEANRKESEDDKGRDDVDSGLEARTAGRVPSRGS